jgi:class 3 adenylate cyclase
VRTGVHAGRCELRGRQPIGVNVHVAARLERLAGPGEIVVSAAVADQLHGTAHAVRDLGTHSLRGVPGAWQVFAIQ